MDYYLAIVFVHGDKYLDQNKILNIKKKTILEMPFQFVAFYICTFCAQVQPIFNKKNQNQPIESRIAIKTINDVS